MTYINVSEGDSLEMSQLDIDTSLIGVAMLQQFSLKAGLRHFGKKSEDAVAAELTQMHAMDTHVPVYPETMTVQQKADALNSLIFLTEKRDGCVKYCMCGASS